MNSAAVFDVVTFIMLFTKSVCSSFKRSCKHDKEIIQ